LIPWRHSGSGAGRYPASPATTPSFQDDLDLDLALVVPWHRGVTGPARGQDGLRDDPLRSDQGRTTRWRQWRRRHDRIGAGIWKGQCRKLHPAYVALKRSRRAGDPDTGFVSPARQHDSRQEWHPSNLVPCAGDYGGHTAIRIALTSNLQPQFTRWRYPVDQSAGATVTSARAAHFICRQIRLPSFAVAFARPISFKWNPELYMSVSGNRKS